MTDSPRVDVDMQGGVATLTFGDAKGVNLLTQPLMEAIIRAGEELRGRCGDVRVVVLTGGGGRSFTAGADLDELCEFGEADARRFIGTLHQVCNLLRILPMPTIARVHGACIGGGLEMAACCDFRVGSTTSRYGMPEIQVGLPSVIEAAMLPTLIGWRRTRELLYTGRLADAEEALEMGLIDKVAAPEALDEAMAPWIEAILSADAEAMRLQKAMIEGWVDRGMTASIQHSIDTFAATFRGGAANERLRVARDRLREAQARKTRS